LDGSSAITKSLNTTFKKLNEILEEMYENEYYTTNDNFLIFDFEDIRNRFYFLKLSDVYHNAEIANEQIADEMEKAYSNLFHLPIHAERKTKEDVKQVFLVLIENLIYELKDVRRKIKKLDNE